MSFLARLERAVELEPGYAKPKCGDRLARTLGGGEHEKAGQVHCEMKTFEQTLEIRDRAKQAESKP